MKKVLLIVLSLGFINSYSQNLNLENFKYILTLEPVSICTSLKEMGLNKSAEKIDADNNYSVSYEVVNKKLLIFQSVQVDKYETKKEGTFSYLLSIVIQIKTASTQDLSSVFTKYISSNNIPFYKKMQIGDYVYDVYKSEDIAFGLNDSYEFKNGADFYQSNVVLMKFR